MAIKRYLAVASHRTFARSGGKEIVRHAEESEGKIHRIEQQ